MPMPASRLSGFLRALVPMGVVFGSSGLVFVSLLLALHWHGSWLLGLLSGLPAVGLAVWFSRWWAGGWTRWAVAMAILRGGLLLFILAGLLWRFDYPADHQGAWGKWIPLQALDFTPMLLYAVPWTPVACAAGLAASYWLIVHRWRKAPFITCLIWPPIWAVLSINGFYRDSFADHSVEGVEAQPGVRVLAENTERACGLFAKLCTARNFARSVKIDPVTRTALVAYGSTAAELHRDEPKLYAIDLDRGDIRPVPGSDRGNQLRHLTIDVDTRLLPVAQWDAEDILVFHLDTLERIRTIRASRDGADFAPATVVPFEDRIVLQEVFFPRLRAFSATTGELERRVDLFERGVTGIGVQVDRGLLSKQRRRLYVPIAQTGINLVEIDWDTLEPGRTASVGIITPASLALDDEGGRLFLGSFGSPAIAVVDLESFRKVDEIQGLWGVRHTLYDPQRDVLYLMDYLGGEVATYSFAEKRITRRVTVGAKPAEAAIFEDTLYVLSSLGLVAVPLEPAVARVN